MNARPLTAQAVRVAVALEVLWAVLIAYRSHDVYTGPSNSRLSMPWDVQLLNFARTWAEPAIAIVVIVWLADYAAGWSAWIHRLLHHHLAEPRII